MTSDDQTNGAAGDTKSCIRLTMKKQMSATGENLCPSCKHVMASGAVICLHCGLDVRSGKQFKTRARPSLIVQGRRASQSLLSVVWALAVILFRVALVATIAYGGWLAYRDHQQHKQFGTSWLPEALAPTGGTIVCPDCRGGGKIKCPTCAGFGSVDAVRTVPCDQCKGTGTYLMRMGKSSVVCPFCKGKGAHGKTVREPCTACSGAGAIACDRCGGDGKVD